MKKNCYNCKFKENIEGDTLVSCNYPKLNKEKKFNLSSLLLITPLQGIEILKEHFGFSVSTSAIASGFFNFPFSFNPNCIEGECNKHSEREEIKSEAYILECISKFFNAYNKISLIKNDSPENNEIYYRTLSIFEKLKANKDNSSVFIKIIENDVNPLTFKIESI